MIKIIFTDHGMKPKTVVVEPRNVQQTLDNESNARNYTRVDIWMEGINVLVLSLWLPLGSGIWQAQKPKEEYL